MRIAYLALLIPACLAGENGSPEGLTSSDGTVYTIDFDSFVDVAPGASDDVAKTAIHRELKSALGALREQAIGVQDRDAQDNLASMTLARTTFSVAGGSTAVDRVRFHYHDTALVEKGHTPTGPITLTMLYGDYVAGASALIPICSDDQTTDADSLWYHYQPITMPQCAAAITAEQRAIDAAKQPLDNTKQISAADANRRFLTTRATLAPQTATPDKWPEYDQLWGFAGDPSRQKIVIYSFFGVNADVTDPHDEGLVEYMRFERYLRKGLPTAGVTYTSPSAFLLDFYVNGQKLPNIGWADVESWVIDGTGFPTTDPAQQAALLAQVQQAFTDRWIVWSTQATAVRNGVSRTMTIEVRTWHGLEDGTDDIRLHARWRYLEAFWNADVFAYTGHSHFGHGPLEPWEYDGSNFPDRYQVMLVNSCLSFNYYDVDFLRMHPEGSAKLDVVVNGLPAYWEGMGQASAAYVVGLVGGAQSYRQLLSSMAVDLPWQSGYDPMRATNGELDNSFDPSHGAIAVTF